LMPVTVTVLVFGRDVGILLVAAILYAAVGRREFRPSIFGKANTLAQISAVAAVLLDQLIRAAWVGHLRTIALDATIALTVASGLHYAWVVSRRTGNTGSNGSAGRSNGQTSIAWSRRLASGFVRNVFGFGGVFNFHVPEFFRVKDLTTFQALDEFCVFVPGDDFYFGMSAGSSHLPYLGGGAPLSARL
jgi:hypothetical protein